MLYYIGQGYDAPITNMFDEDGRDVEDPDEAATIVAELPNGKWLAAQCFRAEIVERAPS